MALRGGAGLRTSLRAGLMGKMPTRVLMPLLTLLLAAAAPPLPPQLNDPNTTEGWIWLRAQAGDVADL